MYVFCTTLLAGAGVPKTLYVTVFLVETIMVHVQ